MNKRHKVVLALSLAVAGFDLLNGAKLSEACGIILLGASLAWLVGSQVAFAGVKFLWRHRIGTALMITLIAMGVFGWIRYDTYQTEKRNAVYQAQIKPVLDCEDRNAQFSNADTACEKDPNVILQPVPTPQPSLNYSVASGPTLRHVKALNDNDLTTTEIGSLKCGHISAGEIAVLLADYGAWVKLRTKDGQVGWAFSSNFEVVRK